MTQKMPRNRSRIFHVPKGVTRAIGNSPVGIKVANRLGYKWMDFDMQRTKDGILVFTHWDDIKLDEFELPRWFVQKYGTRPKVSETYWSDLKRLRTEKVRKKGWMKYKRRLRYYTAEELMRRVAATDKLGAAVEWKANKDFEDPKTYEQFERARIRAGLPKSRVMHMTLQNIGNPWRRLAAMKEADVGPRVLLARGRGVPRKHEPNIDYVRGKWKRIP